MAEPRSHFYTERVKLPQNVEFWPVLVELDPPSTHVGRDVQVNSVLQPTANDVSCKPHVQSDAPSDGPSPPVVQPQSNPGKRAVSFLIPDSHRPRIEESSKADGPEAINVERLERAIRRTELTYQLFQSEGKFSLQSPPNLSDFQWTAVPFDVYYHKTINGDGKRLWVWAVNREVSEWKSVEEGFECRKGAFKGRFLVLTPRHGPSWVSASTVQRTYSHLLTAAAKLDGGRT